MSVYAFLNSDPNNEDSDGDGYLDSTDPNPLVSDVYIFNIWNSNYVSPYRYYDESGNLSDLFWGNKYNFYGGNQSWFIDEHQNEINHIPSGGCGVIAAADTLLYLRSTGKIGFNVAIENISDIDYDDYSAFVEFFSRRYLFPIDLGQSAKIQSIYLRNLSLAVIDHKTADSISEFVFGILSNNTFTWGIWPNMYNDAIHEFLSDKPLTDLSYTSFDANLYLDKNDFFIRSLQNIQNSLDRNIPVGAFLAFADGSMEQYATHWVVITGIRIDYVIDDAILTFSTWGEKRTMSLKEFSEHAGIASGFYYIQ